VDDHRDGADTLGVLLEELGHQVLVTYSGRLALKAAVAFRPNLLLVDLSMPDVNGFEVIQSLRHDHALTGLVIVAITGHKSEEYQKKAISAGCHFVFTKPASLVAILAAVADKIAA
jgi:CheY-like chemotaxis protein